MSELQLFNYSDGNVRIVMIDDEPWFIAADVCAILGIANVKQAVDRLAGAGVCQTYISSSGQRRKATAINEANLYRLILRSDKPAAEPLMNFITEEVLPTLRKTGKYEVPREKSKLDLARELVESSKRQLELIERLTIEGSSKDKADRYELVLINGGYGINDVARYFGYGYSEFREELEELKLMARDISSHRLHWPTEWSLEENYLTVRNPSTPVITEKGLAFIEEQLG